MLCFVSVTVFLLNEFSVCMKDDSPASTHSSSPKLDWMIKRGMVGLCPKTCPGFSLIHPSTPSTSWFCHEAAVYFWCGLDCFCLFGFGVSGIKVKHNGLHAFTCGKVCKMFLEFVDTPSTEHVWFALSGYTTLLSYLQFFLFNAFLADMWLFLCVCVWFGSFVTCSWSFTSGL